ncbi:MAG: Gfo/Idh/MocA family oxidoreductase [Rhodobacteraceae bacterium]|nr:Gfo/Idh/MocA family oxidoreductase [Paracoccaceae bacterium]
MKDQCDPFNVAIVGYGWWGKHIAERLGNHASILVRGIVEPNPSRHDEIVAMGLKRFSTIMEATSLDNLDGFILATPNALHEEQVIRCAKAGKHVFCEKPLGLTAASARRSVAACRRANVQLGVGHERRFEPAMVSLCAAIESGELGTIMHAETTFSHDRLADIPRGDWRTSGTGSPAAGMTATGVHLTDLLISFFGRVETVQAMTASRSLGWETGDVVAAVLGFEAGMTANLSAVMHTPNFIRMHVFGSKKWIEVLNDFHPDNPGGVARHLTHETGQPIALRNFEWVDTVVANLEAFVRAAQGGAVYPFSAEEFVHNIEVLEAITISAKNRRSVFVKDMR